MSIDYLCTFSAQPFGTIPGCLESRRLAWMRLSPRPLFNIGTESEPIRYGVPTYLTYNLSAATL